MVNPNIVKSSIHISDIRQGMTIEWYGEMVTVSGTDIQRCPFMGLTFRGDASKKILTRIQFAVPTSRGVVLR